VSNIVILGDRKMAYVISSGSEPVKATLTADEEALFASSIEVLGMIIGRQRDYNELFQTYSSMMHDFVEYAKNDLGLSFGGILPKAGQFGIRLIRAETALSTFYNNASQTTPSMFWTQTFSQGWNTLFNINLNFQGVTGYPATQLYNNYNLGIFGILDPNPFERLEELQIIFGGTTYQVLPVTQYAFGDFTYIPFPGMIYVSKNQSVQIKGLINQSGQFNGRLFGLEAVVQSIALNEQ